MRVFITAILLILAIAVQGQSEKNFFSGGWQMCDTEGYLELHFINEEVYFCAEYSTLGISYPYSFKPDTIHYFFPKSDGVEKIDIPYKVISYDTVLFLRSDLNYFDSTFAIRLKSADVRPVIMSKEDLVRKREAISRFDENFISRSKEFVCLDHPGHNQEQDIKSLILGHWYYGDKRDYIEVLTDSSRAWFVSDSFVQEYKYYPGGHDHIMFSSIDDEDTVEFRYIRFYNKNEFKARLRNGFSVRIKRVPNEDDKETEVISEILKGYERRKYKYFESLKEY